MYGPPDMANRGLLAESPREHAVILDRNAARDLNGTSEIVERHVRGVWAKKKEPGSHSATGVAKRSKGEV